jgi:hypothetical protein
VNARSVTIGAGPEAPIFIELRFRRPLAVYAQRAPRYRFGFTALTVVAIGAGFATSGVAVASGNTSSAKWIVFTLGLLVAIVNSVQQNWKPSQRSASEYQAAAALKTEGWNFVYKRGAYAALSDDSSTWGVFVDAVNGILRAAATLDEVSTTDPPPPPPPPPSPAAATPTTPPSPSPPSTPPNAAGDTANAAAETPTPSPTPTTSLGHHS